jgi:hypothetical protein
VSLLGDATFDAKDLGYISPVAFEGGVEITTGGDVAHLQTSVAFAAGRGALPVAAIGLRILKKELQILLQLGLIELDDEQIVAVEAPQLGTEEALGVQGIGCHHAILHMASLQPRFHGADLMLFLLNLVLS